MKKKQTGLVLDIKDALPVIKGGVAEQCIMIYNGAFHLYVRLQLLRSDRGPSLLVDLPSSTRRGIRLATNSPGFGGDRYWLVCPLCDKRRVRLLMRDEAVRCAECWKQSAGQ